MTRRELLAVSAALGLGGGAMAETGRWFDTALARVQTPHKVPRFVLEASYKRKQFDSNSIDGPFPFRHDGHFRMIFTGFDGEGYRTGIASSDDLITWHKDGLLIDRGPAGSVTQHNIALTWILRDNDLFGGGELLRVDGRYVGTYHAYPGAGYEVGPAAIGLCFSEDLRRWHVEEPFLHAADGADWERGGLYKSCLALHDGVYYLFYNAKNKESGWIEQTGFATSHDLKTWRRFEGNPVLHVGPKGAWDDIYASDPCLLRVDDVWALFYYGNSSDGHARDGVAFSRDLRTWTKAGPPLIDVGPPGSIDSRYAHKPGMFAWRGKVYHYYCAVSPCTEGRIGEIETGERRGIAVATS